MPTIMPPPKIAPEPPRTRRTPLVRYVMGAVALLIGAVTIGGSVFLSGMRESAARAEKLSQQRACFASQRVLESVIEIERAEGRGVPADLTALRAAAARLSPDVPACRYGGTFEYDPATGSVSCSLHGNDSTQPVTHLGR